jgi:nitrite reductase/ring-hydroxylating ferredoxin subunit
MTRVDPTLTSEPNDLGDTAITPSVTPVLVPASRYTSRDFAELEEERLWPHVWQIACTVDHVPEPGDFYEYRCGRLSVIVVRGDDGSLRAFQNVCRHRGNSICQGSGSGLECLRCPYHHWTWDLEGALREVPSRKGFGAGLRNEDFGLFRVQVDTWGPLVFVNLDLTAAPLDVFLEGLVDDSAWAQLDEFHAAATTITPVQSNWKVVAEGFSETYHVQGIHPEMLGSIDDVHAPQRLWGLHGASYQHYGVASPRLGRASSNDDVWRSFVESQGGRMGVTDPETPLPPIPPGQTVRDVIAEQIRQDQASSGVDLSGYSTEQITRLCQYNLFPNVTVLVQADMVTAIIARPGATVDDAEFVLISLRRSAPGAKVPRAADIVVEDPTYLGLVMSQDCTLLRTAQRGLHQPGLEYLAISSEECRIINLHRNLERHLGLVPSELRPIGA